MRTANPALKQNTFAGARAAAGEPAMTVQGTAAKSLVLLLLTLFAGSFTCNAVATRNPAILGRLKALAGWRETEARSKNLPRGRIVKDDTLNELASHPPKTQDDLAKVRGLSSGWRSNDIGARLMAALAQAKPLEGDELPKREPTRPGLTKDAALVSDLLKLLLKIRAKEAGVAAKLIARSDELEALAAGVRNGLNILSGWRFDEFGSDALDLVEGRLAFATENGKLKMSRIDSGTGQAT